MVITTQKKEKSTITGVRKWFLDKGTIKNKNSIVSIKKVSNFAASKMGTTPVNDAAKHLVGTKK